MELSNGNDSFLVALKNASGGRARLKLDAVQAEFLKTFPHFQGSADRRDRLRACLDELAAAGAVRLPADERGGWERVPVPALPKWILFEGSVLKVLQKGEGHGSHWGVKGNPVKRKARP